MSEHGMFTPSLELCPPSGNVGRPTSCICFRLDTASIQIQAYIEIPDFQIFYIYKLHMAKEYNKWAKVG